MMKLIVQIPCYNEEKTLPLTVKDIPRKIDGIDEVRIVVINDGSTDNTVSVARQLGVDYVLDLPYHRGLAEAFSKGLDRSLELGADIIVNTDGDNQYRGADIAKLVATLREKKAQIVIGCRDISSIKHFSFTKKILQRVGSFVIRKFSGTSIPDATSGFRAYARDAALRLNVFSNYTYTIETIIQAGRKGMPMAYVDISTNEKTRESRLIKNIPSYITKSISTMLRIYLMYEPLKTFLTIGLIPIFVSILLMGRFMIAHFTRAQGGHVQSLIIAAMGFIAGVIIIMIGLLGEIISANRCLNEEILYRHKKNAFDSSKKV